MSATNRFLICEEDIRSAGITLRSVFAASRYPATGFSGLVDTLGKGSLDYSLLLLEPFLPARFPGSSMVEHSAVNRRVASSNLARGANLKSRSLLDLCCFCFFASNQFWLPKLPN